MLKRCIALKYLDEALTACDELGYGSFNSIRGVARASNSYIFEEAETWWMVVIHVLVVFVPDRQD